VQCLGLTGACAACSHCTATAWELSDLDHSHAATPQRVTRASCAQLLLLRSTDFYAWRRLLLICWKLLIGVCVRDGLAASVCIYRTSAASVELRPRGWRAVAFPRWLQVLSCSTWLIVRCCINSSSCVLALLALTVGYEFHQPSCILRSLIHSTHSAKLAPSVRLSLGHFQCKCSHSPYTFSAKHLKCFAGWALSVQVHEALDT